MNTFPDQLRRWQRELRSQFPLIVANPEVAYLDSAATSQKPQAVLDAVVSYLTTGNADAARGTYPWANRTTARVELARDRLRRFVDDPRPQASGVHFVGGTTDGLRAVARDWLAPQLRDGDEIIVPFADHAANGGAWLEAAELLRRQGAHVRVTPMPYDEAHDYDTARLAELVSNRTRLIAATHVHHVYGTEMVVHRLRAVAGSDIPICLDAAQGVGHLPLSMTELDVDFVVFSGHKAMALPGIGAIWARNARGPAYVPAGWTGSPNTTGVISLAAAFDWLDGAGLGRVAHWTTALGARLTEGLRTLPSYELLGRRQSLGIVAFRHRAIDSHDLGFILASEGLLVRADGHCQGDQGEKTASVRVSPHVYNTPEEVDRLLAVLAGLDRSW
ncbi:aminotransferase class V-fold PLP-dependent enzyme [Actinoplanes sp. NPDC051346]|uniref:aminotransferase class V-fold PLP-dependent enzyme n=1 Tax=Actinoplanes sp. NPDC051346 TaxID=3155048 RepID=UPI00342BB0C2